MRLTTILSSAFLLLAFTCSAQQKVSITTMRPAEISWGSDVKTVLVANRFYPVNQRLDYPNEEDAVEVSIGQHASHKCAKAIVEELNQSEMFDTIIPVHFRVKRYGQISPQTVKSTCEKYSADLILFLDDFKYEVIMVHKAKSSCMVGGHQGGRCPDAVHYMGIGDINVSVSLKLLFPNDETENFTLPFYSSYNEVNDYYHDDSLKFQEDNELFMTWITGQYAGIQLAKKMVPYWVQETRYIYANGRNSMSVAYLKMMNGEFAEAIELLKVIESEGREMDIYRAKMNLSYCYEMKDIIWKAKKYATEAYRMKGTKEALELANRLYERDLERRKLKEQFGE